jgi:hypothetical protein
VATVPADAFGEAAIERGLRDLTWVSSCAVGHERVVEAFLRRGTVIPMKLFTIFTSDERAIQHVAGDRPRIDEVVRRLKDRVELGVRVSLASRPARPARSASRAASGARYLRAKKALHDASVELGSRAQARVNEVFEALASQSDESVRRPIVESGGGARVLLDAAYLVPAGRARRFGSTVRALARRFAGEGYDITVTGPWPAYNFVGARA